MKSKFTPFVKLSKKRQKEINNSKRGSWCGVNPVTRISKNSKAYKRCNKVNIEEE